MSISHKANLFKEKLIF